MKSIVNLALFFLGITLISQAFAQQPRPLPSLFPPSDPAMQPGYQPPLPPPEAMRALMQQLQNLRQQAGQVPGQLETLQSVMQSPLFQKFMKLNENKDFQKGMMGVARYQEWEKLTLVELGALLLFIVFRTWRQSRVITGHWVFRLWTALWTTALMWACLLYAIPFLFIGSDYSLMVKGIWQTLW